jgi:hypothetical protein
MAEERGARLIPHGWNTAVGLATDLQLASALPKTDLVEYKTGSPYMDEVAAGSWELDEDGALTIPDEPGASGLDWTRRQLLGTQGGGHDKVALLLSYGTTRVLLAGDAEAKGRGVHSERPLHKALNGE